MMSTTHTATEDLRIARDVRPGDEILSGSTWIRVRSARHRDGLSLIVRADGFLAKYDDTRPVFIRRSVTR